MDISEQRALISYTQHDDILRYKRTNFTLCDLRYNSRIYLGAHHKTGTQLLNYQLSRKTITPYLKEQCDSDPMTKQRKIFDLNYHLDANAIDHWLKTTVKSITKKKKKKNNAYKSPHHIVILNIVRNPVDTVISAYNYHRKCLEEWTKVPLYKITELPFKYQEENENTCTSELFINLTKSMGVSSNVSINELYTNVLNKSEGIYFEYLRYVHCCFDEIYSSYSRIVQLAKGNHDIFNYYDYNLMHFDNLRAEQFAGNFQESCRHLLDKIGILENADREFLLSKFVKFDLNEHSAERLTKMTHVTSGKFNKDQQLEILLRTNDRCNILKQESSLLGYKWSYPAFC